MLLCGRGSVSLLLPPMLSSYDSNATELFLQSQNYVQAVRIHLVVVGNVLTLYRDTKQLHGEPLWFISTSFSTQHTHFWIVCSETKSMWFTVVLCISSRLIEHCMRCAWCSEWQNHIISTTQNESLIDSQKSICIETNTCYIPNDSTHKGQSEAGSLEPNRSNALPGGHLRRSIGYPVAYGAKVRSSVPFQKADSSITYMCVIVWWKIWSQKSNFQWMCWPHAKTPFFGTFHAPKRIWTLSNLPERAGLSI